MLNDGEIDRDAGQLAAYRANDTLSDILDNYSALIQEYRRLKSDYEEERDAREKYKQVAKSQERNPFVLVLVDGDGYVFNEDLVGRGPDAGSTAAQVLNDAVRASLRKKGLEHCQVMVRIYANVAGLSKALNKAGGSVGAEKRSLAPFIASFNRSYGLTEFVDAGELKENADFKLRALLSLYAENGQCKHIYFAACHDVGYISDLTPHTGNTRRFTLIDAHCIRFQKEFTKLGMGIEHFPGVFRNSPLDLATAYRPPNNNNHNSNNNAAAPTEAPRGPLAGTSPTLLSSSSSSSAMPTAAAQSRKKILCQTFPLGKCKFGAHCRYLHGDDPRKAATTTGNPTNSQSTMSSSSWRDSARPDSSAIAAAIKNLPAKDSVPEGHVAVNKNGFRLDPYVPTSTNEAISRLNTRTRRVRVCNNFHLNGYCPAGDNCEYDHSAIEDELKAALETLARSTPCSRRGACRDAKCTKGHVCQQIDCKTRGGHGFCKIPFASHSEDMTLAQYVPAIRTRMSPTINGASAEGSSIFEDDEYDDEGEANVPSGTTLVAEN
ncbi:hypothetical protein B0T11DRAFT_49179 [Plectosphaerella cucumerina]|uniref:C3H1-type domain-containing protein n=1 Tax=Plectosphaerella cucumerina TaxID=40658 RepID=A0A8K0TG45_9PEZI|nr:hypothetical protein B0T11DRAFT_49179 [Plectosphaerella cucumerina]